MKAYNIKIALLDKSTLFRCSNLIKFNKTYS
jgi:hypothetical protein